MQPVQLSTAVLQRLQTSSWDGEQDLQDTAGCQPRELSNSCRVSRYRRQTCTAGEVAAAGLQHSLGAWRGAEKSARPASVTRKREAGGRAQLSDFDSFLNQSACPFLTFESSGSSELAWIESRQDNVELGAKRSTRRKLRILPSAPEVRKPAVRTAHSHDSLRSADRQSESTPKR